MRAPLDIDAIEARANAATPGPWHVENDSDGCDGHSATWPYRLHGGEGERVEVVNFMGGSIVRDEDAAFIAHARTDVPAIIAEVRCLRVISDAAKAVMEARHEGDGRDMAEAEMALWAALATIEAKDGAT